MDEANPDPNLPVSKDDEDENINNGDHNNDDDNDNDNNDNNNDNNNTDNDDEGDDDEDDNCNVDGPTVQAHVDLAKTACKYCRTQHC